MIIARDDEIIMQGSTIELITDVGGILDEFRELMAREFTEEIADRLVVVVGKMIYMTPEDDAENDFECAKEITKLIGEMAAIRRGEA